MLCDLLSSERIVMLIVILISMSMQNPLRQMILAIAVALTGAMVCVVGAIIILVIVHDSS